MSTGSCRSVLLLCLLGLASCATAPWAPDATFAPERLSDVQTQALGDVSVSVSILTDAQAQRHFGTNLARHELQAIWISVRNGSGRRLWFIRTVLDPDYYSAEEVAQLVDGDLPRDARPRLHQFLRDESIRALLLPHAVTEGFVFLPRVEGGRYVDIRLQGDAYAEEAAPREENVPRELRFGFALPLPDGDFDYERLDPDRTYAGRPLPNLDLADLRAALEQLPCCAMDADGTAEGDPLNIVLVGDASEVMNSLSRSGWSFTHRITLRTVQREIGAVLADESYAVAPVSNLYVFGRKQDVALQRARRSISRRNHMRLWMAPFRVESHSVWVGQVSRDIGLKATTRSPSLTTHVIDPQVDATREYLLHSLIAHGFVDRFGFVKGSAGASPERPRYNLTGDPYHSDGMRLVVILTPEPVPPDQIRSLLWEQSAPPIAEGQSEAGARHVRPIATEDNPSR
jgi:LssY C-terminus